MSLADLGPNFAIMKAPSNWALVFFAVALLGIAAHCIFTQKGTT